MGMITQRAQKYPPDQDPVGAWIVPLSAAQRERDQATGLCLTPRIQGVYCRFPADRPSAAQSKRAPTVKGSVDD